MTYPNRRRWLERRLYQPAEKDETFSYLVGRSRLYECSAIAEDKLEVGLGEMFFNLDRADGILILLTLGSLLYPIPNTSEEIKERCASTHWSNIVFVLALIIFVSALISRTGTGLGVLDGPATEFAAACFAAAAEVFCFLTARSSFSS